MATIMDGDSSEFESAPTRQKKSQRKRKIQSDLESDCSSIAKFKEPRRPAKQKVADSGPKSDAPTTAPLRDEDIGSPTSIQDLKSRSEKTYRKVLAFLTSPENAADHETVGFVMASIGKFQALLNESLLYSSRLEGRIEALTAENIDQRRVVSSAVEKCSSQPPPHRQMTFAERVGVKSRVASASNLKQDPPNVVTIVPSDTVAYESSDKTKLAVLEMISAKAEKLQVRNVRRIQGNGILVETAKKSDISALVSNEKLKAAGFVVGAPAKRSPRIIVYDVPRSDNDAATLESIFEQNAEGVEKTLLMHDSRLAFKTGDRTKDCCNWVLEVSKKVRDILINKGRLYIGWQCCKLQDYVAATRCYKCHSFGHTTKFCRAEKESCGHCAAQGHCFKNCPNKNKPPTCTNCKKSGKQSTHTVTDKQCPAYTAAVNQVLSRTDYAY